MDGKGTVPEPRRGETSDGKAILEGTESPSWSTAMASAFDGEERYRAVVEDQTEIISRFRADGTLTFVNEVYCRLFGKKLHELIGQKWQPRALAEDVPLIEARLRLLSPATPVVIIENRVHAASGELCWMQFVNRASFDGDGRHLETQSVGRDITERKRAEEKLHEKQALLRSFYDSAPFMMGVVELEGDRIIGLEANATVAAFFGTTPDKLEGCDGAELNRDDSITRLWLEKYRQSLLERRSVRFEYQHPTQAGPVWLSANVAPLLDSISRRPRFSFVVEDTTERKRAQEREQAEEALRLLSSRMEGIREQERQRLGRELHDGLSQQLTAAKYKVGLLKKQWERRVPVDPAEVEALESELNQALAQARDMAHALNPTNLVGRGLMAALGDLARGVSKSFELECVVESVAPMSVADQAVALHLYRIAQEAVQNAVQHGKARRVVIELTERGGYGRLEVRDDGVGFSTDAIVPGMGLHNLKARARAIGASLDIRPRPGGGTAVACSWSAKADSAPPSGTS